MPRRKQSAGAIRLPGEFYGANSGRYTANAKAGLCGNAYGNTIARSHGSIFTDGTQTGANMHAHPDAIGVQTGGRRRRRRSQKRKSNSNSSNNRNKNKTNQKNRRKSTKKNSGKKRSKNTSTRQRKTQRNKRSQRKR